MTTETKLVTLVLSGIPEADAKRAIDDLYGSVYWTPNTSGVVSFPTTTAVAQIKRESK